MSFLCKQISEHRWGIYSGSRLLATVGDRATCEAIMANFQNARRETHKETPREMPADRTDLPASFKQTAAHVSASHLSAPDVSAQSTDSVKATATRKNALQFSTASGEPAEDKSASQLASMMSDDDLARVLNVKSLKVKELESAVLRAQRGHHRQRL